MNPYVDQAMNQDGASESEVRQSCKSKFIRNSLAMWAQVFFETEEEYLDALHEFLNGC